MSKVQFTPKIQLFIAEYPVDSDGKAAAIRAGFPERGAAVAAHRLLKNANVQKAISESLKEKLTEIGITKENVLRELGRVAFSNAKDLFDEGGKLLPIQELPDSVSRTVNRFEQEAITTKDGEQIGMVTKVRLNDKLKALQMLGQHLGLFNDKLKGGDRPRLESSDDDLQQELQQALKDLGYVRLDQIPTVKIIEAETVERR